MQVQELVVETDGGCKSGCVVCFDDDCTKNIQCERGHIYCVACFEHLVNSQCSNYDDRWSRTMGGVSCSICEHLFDGHMIAQNVSKSIFDVYSDSKKKYTEQKTELELQERLKTTKPAEGIQKHIEYILENILTLKCPNCNAAFLDFDGCLAVKCNKCPIFFCGTGCGFFGDDGLVHGHITGCLYATGELHVNTDAIYHIQTKVKLDKVADYCQKLDDGDKKEVMDALKVHIDTQSLNALFDPQFVSLRQIRRDREQARQVEIETARELERILMMPSPHKKTRVYSKPIVTVKAGGGGELRP